MQPYIYAGLALFMGFVMAIYLPMNSSVARYLGSPITANITFFTIALSTSVITFLLFGQPEAFRNVNKVPPYLYLTGLIGALIVLGATFLVPHLGARRFFILLVAGQIIMAVVVSHFGILESPHDPVTARKFIGASLVLIGAIVTTS